MAWFFQKLHEKGVLARKFPHSVCKHVRESVEAHLVPGTRVTNDYDYRLATASPDAAAAPANETNRCSHLVSKSFSPPAVGQDHY